MSHGGGEGGDPPPMGEAAPPPEPVPILPGMDAPGVTQHALFMIILVMSILLFAFGSGMSRSKWHPWAGGVAVAYGLVALLFTPKHQAAVHNMPTFTTASLHRTVGSFIIILISMQGLTGFLVYLSKAKANAEQATGWRGVRDETPRETQESSDDIARASAVQRALRALTTAVFPFRLWIMAFHGWCGLWLPLCVPCAPPAASRSADRPSAPPLPRRMGFAQVFIAMDMMWSMCTHRGFPLQCTAHIGLSALSTILGFIAIGTALYPHARIIVVAWRHRSSTPSQPLPPQAHTLLSTVDSDSDSGSASPDVEEAVQRVSQSTTGRVGDHTVATTPTPECGSALPHGEWLREVSSSGVDPLQVSSAEQDVMYSLVEVLHHHSNTFLPPTGTLYFNAVFSAWVALPMGFIVCIGHAISAAQQGDPPDHMEAQHVGLGLLGMTMFGAELILRFGPASIRSAAGGRLWWAPRILFWVALGWAMGLHHQHSAIQVLFHTHAGIAVCFSGALLLVELALTSLLHLPEVDTALQAVRQGSSDAPRALLATSPAAQRMLALLRLLRLLQGVCVMLGGIIFVGSSPSTQAMVPMMVPNAWGIGTYYIFAVILVGYFTVVTAVCQAGAVAPQWRTLEPLIKGVPKAAGWSACASYACCCARPGHV